MGPNWPSEATSKASVIKYANEEGPRSIDYPPLKFSIWGPSVRGKQGEPHRPMLPLTGSADLKGLGQSTEPLPRGGRGEGGR